MLLIHGASIQILSPAPIHFVTWPCYLASYNIAEKPDKLWVYFIPDLTYRDSHIGCSCHSGKSSIAAIMNLSNVREDISGWL